MRTYYKKPWKPIIFQKKSQDLIDQKAKRYNFTLLFNKLT